MIDQYGSGFTSQFGELHADGLTSTQKRWAEVLADVPDYRIKYALDALAHDPGRWPPNLGQFVAICRAAPEPQRPSLPKPDVPKETHKRYLDEVYGMIGGRRG